jgi:hypothetical protein
METGRLLISRSKSQEGGVVVKSTQKGQTQGGARSTDGLILPGVNHGRFGRILPRADR